MLSTGGEGRFEMMKKETLTETRLRQIHTSCGTGMIYGALEKQKVHIHTGDDTCTMCGDGSG